ncbi:cyclic pyranopterin monophosphate synthase MoaC [Sphingomonas sp. RG327]|jgi:cyclic pyranopterin phosphate synthase|uniref:Cyclic pyranopterin monophosphate synthase n=1 Tax=Sphingomonas anseongensis TaxID=2908207 RepID=A0ABT0RGZ0_9SPHN|nr:cyclic pyranopterin monophosphate synthase MoaC [Sphingomonas anseongensis]MCL6679205.1 cyclic pyranopterin monophosphate synthase MoaC [Sphingomonas anseongensis]
MSKLSHVDDQGRARMVDVTDKAATTRTATAVGTLACSPGTLEQIRAGTTPKGSVIATAELAGTMAAKRTAELIPLCHPLSLTKVEVQVEIDEGLPGLRVRSEVRTKGVTGVEMEALTAVSVACLTLFDMLKAIDRTMVIGDIAVVSKTGGKSGDWAR